MKTSINELQQILEKYVQEEVSDFLGYEVSQNDIEGIKENIMKDTDNRINEYIQTVQNQAK